MKKFLEIKGKTYKIKFIQEINKIDEEDNGYYRKKSDAKWYEFWKIEFIKDPLYKIEMLYGSNKLLWIEGHYEYSDIIANSFYE